MCKANKSAPVILKDFRPAPAPADSQFGNIRIILLLKSYVKLIWVN